MTWYKQRSPQRAGHLRRHVGISLHPNDWAIIEAEAERREVSVARLLSGILTMAVEKSSGEGSIEQQVRDGLVYLNDLRAHPILSRDGV